MMRNSLVLVLALTFPAVAHAQAESWWKHITLLADDSMRGRETGSREHRLAAEYIAATFRQAGLTPAGTKEFFQPVPFRVRQIDEAHSSVTLVRAGGVERLRLGPDVALNLRGSTDGKHAGSMVFLGYGLQLPGHEDLNGLELRGRIVVLLSGGVPRGMSGPALATARNAAAMNFRRMGVAGIVQVANPQGDVPWDRGVLGRLNPQMTVVDDTASQAPFVVVSVNPASAEKFFAGSSHHYADLQALADSGAPLPRIDLPGSVEAEVSVMTREVTSDNVIGLLPGTDPELKSQYLVLTAHLDHLGVGAPQNGDSIYNGAMDNAAGIATLLETAYAFKGKRLKRSVLFVAVTGEEKGLLGSGYFARHPTVPVQSLVANLNTDMFLPINPLTSLLVNGLEESDLAADAQRAAATARVEVITDPEPERNAFVRSDQFSFIRRGIPALSLKAGFVRGSPEHKKVLAWRRDRYHGVADDLTQPVNRDAAAAFNQLYVQLVTQVANRPTRPAWNADSQFLPRSDGP
jgi:Zn-dependent M28 family amino/carboxypeptidase